MAAGTVTISAVTELCERLVQLEATVNGQQSALEQMAVQISRQDDTIRLLNSRLLQTHLIQPAQDDSHAISIERRLGGMTSQITSLLKASSDNAPDPVSLRAYLAFLLLAAIQLGIAIFFGFFYVRDRSSYFRMGPHPGRAILGMPAETPRQYGIAMFFMFCMQLSSYLLIDTASTPLSSAVYSISNSLSQRRRLWFQWTRLLFHLIIPGYNMFKLMGSNMLTTYIVQQVDTAFTAGVASFVSDNILFYTRYASPDMFPEYQTGRYAPVATANNDFLDDSEEEEEGSDGVLLQPYAVNEGEPSRSADSEI